MDDETIRQIAAEEAKRWPKTLAKLAEAEREEMVAMIEGLAGEIKARGGIKPDWMLRIDESFKEAADE